MLYLNNLKIMKEITTITTITTIKTITTITTIKKITIIKIIITIKIITILNNPLPLNYMLFKHHSIHHNLIKMKCHIPNSLVHLSKKMKDRNSKICLKDLKIFSKELSNMKNN
jgi:hypothetical protein